MVLEQALDRLPLAGVQTQRIEGLDRGARVEDADHDLLAELGGERRNAQVDRLAVHRHPGAAVLGPQPVGDVELGHDLDAGDQRQPCGAGDLHHLPQHAVDAITDRDAALLRLDMDVARAREDALGDDEVH